jgi:hypothetical protein
MIIFSFPDCTYTLSYLPVLINWAITGNFVLEMIAFQDGPAFSQEFGCQPSHQPLLYALKGFLTFIISMFLLSIIERSFGHCLY